MTTSEQQRRALAYLTKTYRAGVSGCGDFDEAGIMAALAKVTHLDLGMVAMAAMRCAADASIKTPAMIGDPSSSVYRERVGPERARRNPSPLEACHTCGQDYTGTCCDKPSQRPAPTSDYFVHAAKARNKLHATTKGDTP